ncbi:MAG TPA: gamma-glutamylcyclotransferase family protein [Solirubrobacterales bacterium]|jgi:cation transport regulator ChaC
MSEALFAYGSLVSGRSLRATLDADPGPATPARLRGWRRRWSVARDNRRAEKRFAPPGGEPFAWCLLLNLERDPHAPDSELPNGALFEVGADDLRRLDARELRYRRVEVSADLEAPGARYERVCTYVARPEHFAPSPPEGAVILAPYLAEVERAFAELGERELARFRESTPLPPAPVVEARLVHDAGAPPGNPREW